MSEAVIRDWLKQISKTVAARDHAAHMQLISKDVTLLGVPGFDNLGYDDWSKQCEYEFANKLLKSVEYGKLRIRVVTQKRLMFMSYETVTANDGRVNAQGIECLLEKEEDGHWRLVQERVLSPEETRQYDLEPASAVS